MTVEEIDASKTHDKIPDTGVETKQPKFLVN